MGLGLWGAASVGVLTGCGLRWESDAPDLPVLPRDRHPGADALRGELTYIEAARLTAASASASTGDDAAVAAHTEQIRALRQRLADVNDLGPSEPTDPPPLPPLPTAPAANTDLARRAAAEAEWAGLDLAASAHLAASGADEQDLLLISSIQVCRLALGRRFGGRWAAASPHDGFAQISAAVTGDLLAAARRCAYVLDVCAARAPAALETTATGSRDTAHRLLIDLDAAAAAQAGQNEQTEPNEQTAEAEGRVGGATPPPPLGYPLDAAALSTPAGVSALAARALADLSDALVAAMPGEWKHAAETADAAPADESAPTPESARPVVALRRRAAECEQWHSAWSSGVRSLPGLR